ncbi:hypothetical protein [Kocuria sp. KH4]
MRNTPTSPPDLQGPTTSTPRFETARRNFQLARFELTAAALDELTVRVRIRYPQARELLLLCDDVEDGLYLAGITDGTGTALTPSGPLLDDRATAQMIGNLRGAYLALLPGVVHEPAEQSFRVRLAPRPTGLAG